jgi:hypothetical protein
MHIGEVLKKVPLPLWIGLGLVLIVIVLLGGKSSSSQSQQQPQTTPGPVTASTVGQQGSQAGAGTDQELGNLSQITQGGFAQIHENEKVQTGLLQSIQANMNGVGTPMQQFGNSIQTTQNDFAATNAAQTASGQPVAGAANSPQSNTPATSSAQPT